MKTIKLISLLALFVIVSCSTKGTFKIPAGSQLFVEGVAVPQTMSTTPQAGPISITEYKRAPFNWQSSKGIPYRIEKDGKIIDMGKIDSQFMFFSVIWQPFGFKKDGYDFTSKMDPKVIPDVTYYSAKHRQ